MNDHTAHALNLVRQALGKYTDTPIDNIQLDTVLVDIQIDSLTLAELLFELEDQLHTTISETGSLPQHVSDLVELILPCIDQNALKSLA
jgi:acyl carrier protein